MSTLKVLGMLAAIIFLLPFIYNGLEDVQDLRRVAGAACIIDGDESRRLATVQQDGDSDRYALTEGSWSTCKLGADVSDITSWAIEDEEYRQVSSYAAGNAFPVPAWNWPVTLTWDDGMSIWTNQGWLGQTYAVYLRLLPAMLLLTLAGLGIFVWALED